MNNLPRQPVAPETLVVVDSGVIAHRFPTSLRHERCMLPEAGNVHLWHASLDEIDPDSTNLSMEECARAARFRFDRHKRRYVASRIFLRLVLSAYSGLPAVSLPLGVARDGKPTCDGLAFNLSHSDDCAVIAIAPDGRVGVDVEAVRPIAEIEGIAASFPAEGAKLTTIPAARRLDAFFACWTAKEAFLKAVGTGLLEDLSSFEVSVDPDAPAQLMSAASRYGPVGIWRMRRFRIGARHLGTIAQELSS
ncbi:MAG: 4'-phosphopantetheinyl transferase superfamily protein [Rhodospirillales bacterium]|nr:4'-phosphopantetheinyl transferase superfamily protein [Rhodospirillales bacterium]